MKQLSTAEVKAMSTVLDKPKIMNTRERRERAIEIVKSLGRTTIMESYEYFPFADRALFTCGAFKALAADKELKAAGLKGSSANQIADFFNWSEHQMHVMFCYCHHHMDVNVHGVNLAKSMQSFG